MKCLQEPGAARYVGHWEENYVVLYSGFLNVCAPIQLKKKLILSEFSILWKLPSKNKGIAMIDTWCGSESVLGSGELSKDTERFGCAWGFEPVFVCCGVSVGISSSSSETSAHRKWPRECQIDSAPEKPLSHLFASFTKALDWTSFSLPLEKKVWVNCPKSLCRVYM